jgi:hypothetical protein
MFIIANLLIKWLINHAFCLFRLHFTANRFCHYTVAVKLWRNLPFGSWQEYECLKVCASSLRAHRIGLFRLHDRPETSEGGPVMTRNFMLRCAVTLALLGGSTALAAKTIIVKSAGPSATAYPPGKPLAETARLALKAGDTITILDAKGTRVFRGPGNFAIAGNATATVMGGNIMQNTGARQIRTGAVRGGGGMRMSRPANIWMIDISKSGTVCYNGTEAVRLWVPRGAGAPAMTLTRLSDNKSVPLALRAGQMIASWPVAEMPLTNGAQFRIAGNGAAIPVTLKFASVGGAQGLDGTAAALISAGCMAQLDHLIEPTAIVTLDEESEG